MTVAITDYASLSSAINDIGERSYIAGELDRIIGLAEAEFRLHFGPNFAKETASASLAFTTGSATLPSGFIRALSLVHATYGGLTERTVGAIRERRVWDTSGIPSIYAITGATVLTAATYTGNLALDYEGSLVGLSGSNTTNWLITNAPQAYLSMCLSMDKLIQEEYPAAAALRSVSLNTLDDLGIQSMVATLGRASVTIPGATP
jgi:hypothetical protein